VGKKKPRPVAEGVGAKEVDGNPFNTTPMTSPCQGYDAFGSLLANNPRPIPVLNRVLRTEAKRLREARDLKSAARVLRWMLANGMPVSSMTVENENGPNGE
jgi:hypothetical protein